MTPFQVWAEERAGWEDHAVERQWGPAKSLLPAFHRRIRSQYSDLRPSRLRLVVTAIAAAAALIALTSNDQ